MIDTSKLEEYMSHLSEDERSRLMTDFQVAMEAVTKAVRLVVDAYVAVAPAIDSALKQAKPFLDKLDEIESK